VCTYVCLCASLCGCVCVVVVVCVFVLLLSGVEVVYWVRVRSSAL